MAKVSVTTIHRLVARGVLKPYTSKKGYFFEAGYAKRLAPIIATRNEMANSLPYDNMGSRYKIGEEESG